MSELETLREEVRALNEKIRRYESGETVIRIEKQVEVPPADYIILKTRVKELETKERMFDCVINNTSPPIRKLVSELEKSIQDGVDKILDELLLLRCGNEERFYWFKLQEFMLEIAHQMEELNF